MSKTKYNSIRDTRTEGHGGYTGQGINRFEDYEILTGDAEYAQDRFPDDALVLAFVRSDEAHAEIVDIDTATAKAHPECRLVLTGADLTNRYEPMPCGVESYEEWALANEKVRFVGEPVAAVVATDRYVAEDIADLVDIEYDPLPTVIDPFDAITDDVLLHEGRGTNVADHERLEFGAVDDTLENADHVVTGEFSYGRASGVPIETSGVVAEYNPDSDSFDIFSNLQVHTLVADQVYEPLGYEKEEVRLWTPEHIGGSYGTKSSIHRYCCVTAMASQLLKGRPIKFTEGRKEYLEGGDTHSSEREYELTVGLDGDGTIRALDVWFVENFGAYPRHPAVEQVLKPLSCVTNSYDIEHVRYDYRVALTNKTSQAPYRGYGVPPHIFALESAIDLAARETGLDADMIRRKNLIQPEQMPYQTASKNIYDSGDYPGALDRIESLLKEKERCEGGLLDPNIVAQKRSEGTYRGVQPIVAVEVGGSFAGWSQRQHTDDDAIEAMERDDVQGLPENLFVSVDGDGRIEAKLATNTTGQGHQTVLAQLLADEFEVQLSRISVSYLHSGDAPKDYGAAGSRMAIMMSGAAAVAGESLRENLCEIAAEEWDCESSQTQYRDGSVIHGDTGERLNLSEMWALENDTKSEKSRTDIHAVYEHPVLRNEEYDTALENMLPAYASAGFAVNAPIVEVDAESGQVEVLKFYTLRDCGNMLNPTIVEGQAHGGIIQGMGASLQEEFIYDDDGTIRSDSLFEYLMPTIRDVPEIELHHSETPGRFTERGVKGVGEGGMIDVPASIAASVNDALNPLGVVVNELPFTANRAYHHIQSAQNDS